MTPAPGHHLGFAILGTAGWARPPQIPAPVGHALWTTLFLQRLDPAHMIEINGRLGGDPAARSVLRLLQNRGLAMRGLHQDDQITTWDGLTNPPETDEVFLELPRLRASTAALCLEPQQTAFGARKTLLDLRERGLRVLALVHPHHTQNPNGLLGADYVVAGNWDHLQTPLEIQSQAQVQFASGVFLVSICIGRAGVARMVRGQKKADFSPWPAPLGRNQKGCLAAAGAACLHALRRNYDGHHTVELTAACAWLGSTMDDPRQVRVNEIEILGTALRISRGLEDADMARSRMLVQMNTLTETDG